jgi:outer membrane biosynthesis protein TonB
MTTVIKPNIWAIVGMVLVVHAVALFLLLREQVVVSQPIQRPRVVVKTVSLAPQPVDVKAPVVQAQEVVRSAPKPEPEPKPKPKPAVKPAPAKPVVAKKETPKPPAPKPTVDLSKARESLAALKNQPQETSVARSNVVIPTLAPSVASLPQTSDPTELSYNDDLIVRLRSLLRLPEYGDVKVSLTIDRSGKVLAFEVLQSENAANKRYVDLHLPRCKFADFGKHFADENSKTFQLTLSNDL